jgi:hypothetical protein
VAQPVTPATQEAEMRSILIKHQPGQIVCEILSQKKPIQKGLMEWLKWYSTCLASMRTQVQIPVPQKFFFKKGKNSSLLSPIERITKVILFLSPLAQALECFRYFMDNYSPDKQTI